MAFYVFMLFFSMPVTKPPAHIPSRYF